MKLLLEICAFLLSFPVMGQSSYYLAAQTVIRNPNDVEWQTSKYKFESKWDVNGYIWFSASYYWDTRFIENPNPTTEKDWIGGWKTDWTGDSKYEYVNNGLKIFYEWNYDIDDWAEVKKIEREQDSNGNELSCIVYSKEIGVEQWTPSYKTEDEYNTYNRGILHIEYNWDKEANDWSAYHKHEDKYDADGRRILWISYTWNKLLNHWESTNQATFDNDAKGRLIRQINYVKKDSVWMRTNKIVVQKYNKNGKEDLCIFYNWKQNSSKWVEEGRNEAQKERKTNSKTSRHWDVGLNKWIDNAKAESQYDAQGREILSVSYKWNAVENRWEQVSKTETAYDENNNPISILFYAWWQENWVLSETRENSYVKRD